MAKVLIVTYGGGHANIVKSIYPQMENKEIDVEIIALTTAAPLLSTMNIPHYTISFYLKYLPEKEDIKKLGRDVCSTMHNVNSGIDEEDTVAYCGMGLYELRENAGDKYKSIFKQSGRKSFLPIILMEKLLEIILPDVIVLTSSVRFCKAMGIAGNKKNIPVIYINDLPMLGRLEFNSKICVMNEYTKQEGISKGICVNDIIVTGQPVMEENLFLDDTKIQENKERIKNWDKVILYLGLPDADLLPEGRQTLNELEQLAIKHKEWLFIIRPHPNNFDNYLMENKDNLFITKEGELKYLLELCDIAITQGSTSGMEAALLGKPVITILNETKLEFYLADFKIAYNINDASKLEETVIQLLDENSLLYKQLEEGRKNFNNKSNAAKNIIDVILNEGRRNEK